MRYTAKGEHNRHFELFDDKGTSVGRVDYDGWFSVEVTLIYKGNEYKVAPANFWHTRVDVRLGDTVIAEMSMNWAGHKVIELAEGKTYLFKHGFFDNRMTLYTPEEKGIITLQPDFVWSKFSFNYDIETDDNYTEGSDGLLLLILIYCCNNMKRGAAV